MDQALNQKPFDEWNEHKKSVQKLEIAFNFFYHPREVWRCSVGVNVGVETDGKHEFFERPVLVVTKFNKEMFWGVPLTSKERSGRFFHKITYDTGTSWVMLSQLRVFSSKRLIRKMGIVSDQEFQEICTSLCGFIEKSKPSTKEGFSEAEATNMKIISGAKDESSRWRVKHTAEGDIRPGNDTKNEVK